MRFNLLGATAALAFGALGTIGAQAAPVVPSGPFAQSSQSLAQPVDYRNYCGRWRDECRERWGFRSWRYRRCMSYHGCY